MSWGYLSAVKCKAFDQILKELNDRPDKLDKWLLDKRMSSLEKKILIGHSWIRNNLNQKVLDEIPLLAASDLEFVEAHRAHLIGIAANNLSHFKLASEQLEKATELFKSLGLHYYQFLGHFNLFILASNQVNIQMMEEHLKIMRLIPKELPLQKLKLMRCEFIFADESNQSKEAYRWLKKIEAIKTELPEGDIISHLVSEFMFLIKMEELSNARNVLDQMKKHRKFQLSENYNYMKKLLEHITENKPIYAYAADFKEVPLLFHQLHLIQSLEASELEEAHDHWKSLHQISPELYGDAFEYRGTKSLFSLALKKHMDKKKVTTLQVVPNETKVDQLISFLMAHPAGLKKAHLYELLWNESPNTKDDLKRLARLVSRARLSHQLEIQTRKGCYFVEIIKKKIAN